MMTKKLIYVAALSAVAIAGVSCGGGPSDETGAPKPLSVDPPSTTLTTAGPDCLASLPVTVLINGGAGGYSVVSTYPDIQVGPVTSTSINGTVVYQFTFQKVMAGCSTGELIQVTDAKHNWVTATVASASVPIPGP